jgi:RNA polymerase sigma factor, sigma-70 family
MEKSDLARLHARARRLTASRADAEDLCQDVVLAFLSRQAKGAQIERPLAYMMTALRHAAHARSKTVEQVSSLEEADLPSPEDAHLTCFVTEVIARIDDLPAVDRALLRRVLNEQVTPTELAKEADLPVGTIMSRLARARSRLRQALGMTSMF